MEGKGDKEVLGERGSTIEGRDMNRKDKRNIAKAERKIPTLKYKVQEQIRQGKEHKQNRITKNGRKKQTMKEIKIEERNDKVQYKEKVIR